MLVSAVVTIAQLGCRTDDTEDPNTVQKLGLKPHAETTEERTMSPHGKWQRRGDLVSDADDSDMNDSDMNDSDMNDSDMDDSDMDDSDDDEDDPSAMYSAYGKRDEDWNPDDDDVRFNPVSERPCGKLVTRRGKYQDSEPRRNSNCSQDNDSIPDGAASEAQTETDFSQHERKRSASVKSALSHKEQKKVKAETKELVPSVPSASRIAFAPALTGDDDVLVQVAPPSEHAQSADRAKRIFAARSTCTC